MRQKLLILAAVFFGILAFMLTYQQINQEKRKIQASTADVALLQVMRDVPENDVLTADDLRGVKVKRIASQISSSRDVPFDQRNLVVGRKSLFPIRKGQFLQWTDLQSSVSSGRDGITRIITQGYRAVAIAVDPTSSVAGLVQPGNYVDLIGTFRLPEMRGDNTMDMVTLTLLQRVRVLATGSDYGINNSQGRIARSYSTVTLELSPKEVEMVIFAAQKGGSIKMSLRNFEDAEITGDLQSVNWKYLNENIRKYTRDRENRSRKR